MRTRALVHIGLLLFAAASLAPAAFAQLQVATFASVAGTVEVQRGGKGD